MENPTDKLLKQSEVAEILSCSTAWLEQSRFRKTGIPFVKIGRACRYKLSDVRRYIEMHTFGAGI